MRKVLIAFLAVFALTATTGSITQAVGQPDRWNLGQGRYDNFKPDPKASAARHTGHKPHATQNWSPRPDCFKYSNINGPIPAGYQVKKVIREYNRKTNGVPPLNWMRRCNGGIADIRIDAVNNPRLDYCSKYVADFGGGTNERIILNGSAAQGCADRKRESTCFGIGGSIGQHAYKSPTVPTSLRKGCMWLGQGPRMVSPAEARALNRAW